ncbi:flagellar basal body P-ring formation chaperone FlgA [Mangrovicoccus sp. HB161399]|uniref:flagellar basal body P-ring formation chaperone FlgA n=1 Tax=Mangrovicoccus sp. HB161399 TaxID=2720392 RepID=UPI001555C87E|nr:flagellar basal body P-ring formation chaperone FlgA [Mangrovicoccus sp. HB161399]
MRSLLLAMILVSATPAAAPLRADVVVTARPVRSGTVLGPSDILLQEGDMGGALSDPGAAIGMQTVRNLFPGSPIAPEDLQRPHIVTRNQEVTMIFENGLLSISTEGRALDGGAAGDTIRVTNVNSRKTVTGKVMPDGSISVSGAVR